MTGDTVVVPRIDRLARNLTEGLRTIEELHAQGIHIRALAEGLDTGDGSPTARLMLHMLLSLAEWERETIRDRIRAGVARAAAEGRTGGRPPALDSEKLQAVRAFLDNGGSVSAAARSFGVSRPTVGGSQSAPPDRPPGTGGRASPWRLSQSSSPPKCRFHLGFSLVREESFNLVNPDSDNSASPPTTSH